MMPISVDEYFIRIVNINDDIEIYKILSDEEILKNLNMKIHKNIEDTKNMINEYLLEYKKGNKYPFAIIEQKTNKFVGVFLIKLDLYNEDSYEFTVYIGKRFWNKGIYTEVLKEATKFVFENIGTSNFRGYVMENNTASSIVLQKCRFKLEKTFKVDGIDGMINSYLMTKIDYKKIYKEGK